MLVSRSPAEYADWHLCPLQFVDKEPTLAEPVLSQLLKFWPVINSQKEVLFLGEMEEILELTQVRGSLEPGTAGRLAQHVQPA